MKLIGIDDTDSLNGMCTTYLAAMLCEKLDVVGYPKLIRLNPNIPYRTRGNAAIAVQVEDNKKTEKRVLKLVKKHAHLSDENTNPGVVFIDEPDTEQEKILEGFYTRAVSELVTLEEAEETADQVNAKVYGFNNRRGIIGALAAAGFKSPDRTYELIAYRAKRNHGTKRKIDEDSIHIMNKKTFPHTFDNIDPETKQILIMPHGPDPILCGIRGNTPKIVERAWTFIKPKERVERVCVFETNQGTDAHLRPRKIPELKPYDCAILKGEVAIDPQDIVGGHVFFGFSDGLGKIACAAYEPTGKFRETIRKLRAGDEVTVYGCIGKHPNTLNLEKIQVNRLVKAYETLPPECCNRRMTSAGTGKGFKCKKCSKRKSEDDAVSKEMPRELKPGFYEVPPRARRHLNKPLIRMEQEQGID